jgi:hypothetical protein
MVRVSTRRQRAGQVSASAAPPARKRSNLFILDSDGKVQVSELRRAELNSKLQRANTVVTMLACKLAKMTKRAERAERKSKRSDTETRTQKDLRIQAERATKVAKRETTAALAKAEVLKTVATNQLRAAGAQRKAATRAIRAKDKRVSVSNDGTRWPLHKVQVASRVQGGRRMALDEVNTATLGSLQVRSGCFGWLEYRLEELVFLFKAEVYAGIDSSKALGPREEANILCRAHAAGATVHVVQPPLRCSGPKYQYRRFPGRQIQQCPPSCGLCSVCYFIMLLDSFWSVQTLLF